MSGRQKVEAAISGSKTPDHKWKKIGVKAQRIERFAKKKGAAIDNTWRSGWKLFVVVVVGVGLLLWGIVVLILVLIGEPKMPDYSLGGDTATSVQERAQEAWQEAMVKSEEAGLASGDPEAGIEAVNDYFSSQLAQANSEKERVDLTLIEMSFLAENAQPAAVIRASSRVSLTEMDETQRGQYWGMLMNAYYNLGDYESGNYFAGQLGTLQLDESEEGVE